MIIIFWAFASLAVLSFFYQIFFFVKALRTNEWDNNMRHMVGAFGLMFLFYIGTILTNPSLGILP